MAFALPVIEIVKFCANKKCLEDPGLFREVREMAHHDAGEMMARVRSLRTRSTFRSFRMVLARFSLVVS